MPSGSLIRRDMAEKLKTIRSLTRTSVKDFSLMMRVSEPAYRRIVSGQAALKVEAVVHLSDSLGVPPDLFLSRDMSGLVAKILETKQ